MSDIAAWARWMSAANLRPDTIAQRVYHVNRVVKETGADPWTVTAEQLIDWLGTRDWAPNTLRSYRASLRAFYSWGQGVGRRQDNPGLLIPSVKVPRGVPRPAPEEIYRMALVLADERTRLMVHLAAICGLRRGEISRLKHEHVVKDLVGWSLRIDGKGGHVRLVPLPVELAIELRRTPVGWVFPSTAPMATGPLTPAHVGKLVSRLLPDGWTCHSLRHRCGTIAYAGTKDIRAVQEFLGHANVNTTQLYTKIPADAIRAAMRAAAA